MTIRELEKMNYEQLWQLQINSEKILKHFNYNIEEDSRLQKLSECEIDDYRPTDPIFNVPFILNAIIVWLRNGNKIIYIYKGN